MTRVPLIESIVSIILVALGVLLLNPYEFWMPDVLMYCLIAIALVAFGLLGAFVLREEGDDEREVYERSAAGRYAYLAGAGVLLIGILYQGWFHSLDPWLVVAFGTMLLTKLSMRFLRDRTLE